MGHHKPILVLDFDGTMTTYASGWQGIAVCPDPPTPGLERFLERALPLFEVHVYSSRSGEEEGRIAMEQWCYQWLRQDLRAQLHFPTSKPPAMLTIDDRAQQFHGDWREIDPVKLRTFMPWTQHSPPPNEGRRDA